MTAILRKNFGFNKDWQCLCYRLRVTFTQRRAERLTCGIVGNVPLRYISGIDKWNEDFNRNLQLKIENHWKTKLLEQRFDPESPKEKMYILSMFPYPSGHLHMGHVRVYGLSDTLARYFRMRGKNVIHPMGWDAFGLPAENAAFERGINPAHWTQMNIANMKSVIEDLNFSFDWDREFATCDSDYYRWTQFLFLKLYEMGLVYRDEELVNWDPVDQTVLADEQVDSEGRSWRSGAVVEKKKLRQWFVKTSTFAKSLQEGLSDPILEGWKEVTKLQNYWIGDVNGTCIDFEVVDKNIGTEKRKLVIYLKYPEYIHRGKFIAVKKDSKWSVDGEVGNLLPFGAKNPFTEEILPVYCTNSVSYYPGADVHLGIPELNESDKEFADLMKIKYTLEPILAKEEELIDLREKICEEARERGIGGFATSSRLKDWLISRQRYWGTPIPIIHCPKCGEQPVPEKELPVRLPEVKTVEKGCNALEKQTEWLNTVCPKCGGEAKRETDTMDTFVDSCWYFLRFLDPDNENAAFGVDKVKKLMPVDVYIGGVEHALLHLFYARFMNHFLHSVGLVPHPEPFKRLVCVGMVKAFTYKASNGQFIPPDLVEIEDGKPVHKETREPLIGSWEKMSKSKHNAVEPKRLLEEYGIDMTRLVIICSGTARSVLEWDEKLFKDIEAWQRRMWLTVEKFINLRSKDLKGFTKTEEYNKLEFYIFDSRNFYLKKITDLIEKSLNMGVALKKMQALTNSLRKCNDDVITYSIQFERTLALQIILLAPFAPHFASELWAGFVKAPNRLCKTDEILWDRSVFEQPWPQVDENYKPKSDEIKGMLKTR